MDFIGIIALLISLSACFMYINYRFIKLPETIGIMVLSLVFSLGMVLFQKIGLLDFSNIANNIDFETMLMKGMLSFLLFAGALHIDINDLVKQKWIILVLATLGVVTSTFLVGSITYLIITSIGIFESSYELLIYCMLFGSLISPTDPISVLGILKEAKAPKTLETKITGESLFNDGVGVVVFMVIMQLLPHGDHSHSNVNPAILFIQEAAGGIIFGFIVGWIFYKLLKSVDNYSLEILLTLSLVSGGYYLAGLLHISGPIAMVVSGLLIGNHGKIFAMSETTHKQLFSFWELIDEFLNAVLFLLMGMVVVSISFDLTVIGIGLLMIPITLIIRYLCVASTVQIFKIKRSFTKGAAYIMTWGGLRGGISIAMALSLPSDSHFRDLFILITYIIVLFSIIVQGLTVKSLVKYFLKQK